MPLNPESTGLAVQWNVDLARLEWTLARTTPACLHCCMSSNTDSLLNAALAVSDAAGEAALDGVSSHFLAANGKYAAVYEGMDPTDAVLSRFIYTSPPPNSSAAACASVFFSLKALAGCASFSSLSALPLRRA